MKKNIGSTKLPVINKKVEANSAAVLNAFYQNKLIPPEKKSYLTELKASRGPYMGITGENQQAHYILDGASQIATLGLGFNAPAFFGVAQHQEAWSNDTQSERADQAIEALKSFFARKTRWPQLHMALAHSGAEANEIALGEAYQNRRRKSANRVLAFEGSFHGRMMITLSSTWNKSKREPFEWPGFETIYSPFADDPKGDIFSSAPNDWKQVWAGALKVADYKTHWKAEIAKNPLIEREIDVLLNVKKLLGQGDIFALIAEPMQCEGGDRYGTARFFSALALICRELEVALIFDEVQTGFHLGRDFFWHSTFKLTDHEENPLLPDFVTCAKKAQLGLVLSPRAISLYEHPRNTHEFQLAGLLRGLTHALALDQSDERILTLEVMATTKLGELVKNFEAHLANPRAFGLSFAVDLKDKNLLNKLIERRFDVGLLYYPAGDNTLRFRLNTAFKKDDVDNLFHSLNLLFDHLFENKELKLPEVFESQVKDPQIHYQLSELLLACKMRELSEAQFTTAIKDILKQRSSFELVEINQQNYPQLRDMIVKLESEVYEPARQTDISHFDHAMKNRNGLAFALTASNELKGIIFAAPLSEFPLERGLRLDPHFTDPDSLYMLDCTVRMDYQGGGLGLILKAMLTGIATLRGRSRLQGRNRDRMAASMLNINLELGAIPQNYIREDYPDFEPYRDVLYYSIPLQWNQTPLDLSSGEMRPFSSSTLSAKERQELLPVVVNKICLSNFVAQSFLDDIKTFADLLPLELRHLYTTSGQSEAVDKVAKTLWFNRDKEKMKAPRFLTFKDHYFGAGSFLARGLSQIGESLFPVDVIEGPNELEATLKRHQYLALYLEPVGQLTGHCLSVPELKGVIDLCHKYGVKVAFNESAAQAYRAHPDHYFLACHPELDVDAGMCYLGGQAGIVYCKEELFIAAPLMMISTWDGDELSFALAAKSARLINKEKRELGALQKNFEGALKRQLAGTDVQLSLNGSVGTIAGNLPLALQKFFRKSTRERTWVVNPSFEMMKCFIKDVK